ncbi:MAG TPA: response regulator [Clostridiales bacterium]|nr:response regulator [Clostridiales bacterium]
MGGKILIIDDDTDITTAYGAFFRSRGFEVMTAFNTKAARKIMEQFAPDLLILDVMMEEPDEGFVFAQQLLDEKNMTPVIITSSIASAGAELFDLDIPNVRSVIQKPADLDKLSSLVEKILAD